MVLVVGYNQVVGSFLFDHTRFVQELHCHKLVVGNPLLHLEVLHFVVGIQYTLEVRQHHS